MDIDRLLNHVDDVNDVVDGLAPEATSDTSPLRVGKWTMEEVRYATALVKHFVAGTLAIPSGTSLRSYVAEKLHCSAMRVSTKLAAEALGGFQSTKKLGLKRFFPMDGLSSAQRELIAYELHRLRVDFLRAANLDELESDEPTTRASLVSACSSSSSCSTTTTTTMMSDDETDTPWRIGNWSHDEQLYACALIDGFMRGRVNVADGTTLRAYLSERLCCNPMRISKKLATGKMASAVIPKRLGSVTYHIQARDAATVQHTEHALERLRLRCFPTAPRYVHEVVTSPPRPLALPQLVPTTAVAKPPYVSMPAHAWAWTSRQGFASASTAYAMTVDGNELSPLYVGAKRKLPSPHWSLAAASGVSLPLPPLVSAFDKRPRLLSGSSC